MTAARPLPHRPVGLVVRAGVVLVGAALAAWGAATPRDAVYLTGLGVVALALLSLVSAEAARPPLVVRALAVVAALAVIVAGVWVPRSAALAAATTARSIDIDELDVVGADQLGLTGLSSDDLLLTDGLSAQRIDLGAGSAADSFVFRDRGWLAPGGVVVQATSLEVRASTSTGAELWRRAAESANEEDAEPVAAADGVVVVETCDDFEPDDPDDRDDRARACRRTGVGPDGEVVFATGGYDLTTTAPREFGGLADDGAVPRLPAVFVSRPGASSDDVEIRAASDGRVLQTVRRDDAQQPTPVVTGRTVLVSSGPGGACVLAGHRDGRQVWSVPDPACTPTFGSPGRSQDRPTVTGHRLWLPDDDSTLTLDLRDGAARRTPTGRQADPGRDLGRTPALTAWTQDAEVRLAGRTLSASDPATGKERWRRTLPRRALRWWVRGGVVAVRSATSGPLLLDPADTDEQVTVYDSRTGRVRDTLRLARDEDDDRDSLFVPYDDGMLRLAPAEPDDDDDESWRADRFG